MQLSNVLVTIFGIAAINAVTVFPLIFNLYVIPHIEKKVGKKLEYTSFFYNLNGWSPRINRILFKNLEVACYVVSCCLFAKKIVSQMSLAKAHYQFELISWFEIMISFLAVLNTVMFLTCGILLIFY